MHSTGLATVEQCRNQINNKHNYPPQTIYNSLKLIRQTLCKQDAMEQQINLLLQMQFHIDLHKFMNQLLAAICPVYTPYSHNDLLMVQRMKMLQECLWIFTNISVGQSGQAMELVRIGIIQVIQLTLKMTKFPQIIDCTLKLVGNIVGDHSLQIKLTILKSQSFRSFYKYGYKSVQLSISDFGENLTWVLANSFLKIHKLFSSEFSHYQSETFSRELVQFYLPIVAELFSLPTSNFDMSNLNLYNVLKYMTFDWNYFYPQIDAIIRGRFQQPESSTQIKEQIIQIYGNMASQSEFGVKCILQQQFILSYMLNVLKNKKPKGKQKTFMKNCGWVLSNILAGTQQQIDFLLKNYSTFFNQLYEIFEISQNFKIFKELVWAVCNMIQSCSLNAFQMLFSSNILQSVAKKVLIMLKNNPDESLSQVFLQGVQQFIIKHNLFPQKFGLQINQKNALMEALIQATNNLSKQYLIIRAKNAAAYLESLIIAGQISAMQIC